MAKKDTLDEYLARQVCDAEDPTIPEELKPLEEPELEDLVIDWATMERARHQLEFEVEYTSFREIVTSDT